jgi:hypothetical protein
MLVTRRAARLSGEISIDLAPALLGSAVPSFEPLEARRSCSMAQRLVVRGDRVTHLRYPIRRP